MLCGVLPPSSGTALVAGFDVRKKPDRVKANIGYMTQRFSLYEDLTVVENLRFYASIYGVARGRLTSRIDALMATTGLLERRNQVAGTLSGGWKQRLALACAMVHEPPLIFLDEPTAGVDPVTRRAFWEHIHSIAATGTTVVVTTHYMDEAARCHRLAFMAEGVLLDEGHPDELISRRQLSVVEIEVTEPERAAAVLRASGRIEELSHKGPVLRVTTVGGDAKGIVSEVLDGVQEELTKAVSVRPTVEDAFVQLARARR